MNLENCEMLNSWSLSAFEPVLKMLGVHNLYNNGESIRCSCPHGLLGKDYHDGKNNTNPAYEVTVTKDGWVRGHCFSCQDDEEFDDVEHLLVVLRYRALKVYPNDLHAQSVLKSSGRALRACAMYHSDVSMPINNLATVVDIPIRKFLEYPETLWNKYRPATESVSAMAYLQNVRGLSVATILEMDIRYHVTTSSNFLEKYSYLYVGFPYYNSLEKRAGIRWRCTAPDEHYDDAMTVKRGWKLLKHTPYLYPDKAQCNVATTWFRESKLCLYTPIVIVEGQFDVAAIMPFYKNVTCLFKNSCTDKKLDIIRNASFVIWLGDNDGGKGDKGRPKAKKFFEMHGVKYLDLYYPDQYKDAGETPRELLEPLILNAVSAIQFNYKAIK